MEKGLSRITNQDEFIQRLIDSKSLPIHVTSVPVAFTIIEYGKELGFKPMAALHLIIPIQGKLSLAAKALNALLRTNGVKIKTLEDGVYVYKDGVETTKRKEEKDEDGNTINKYLDIRTTIRFTRDGEEEDVSYSLMDAHAAGYLTKENWKRMLKEMLWARCLTKGANRVAADIVNGLYSTDEMHDATGQKERVIRDEDGTITDIVDVEHTVVN